MRKIRIATDNTPSGTVVVDDNTGEEIKAVSVTWRSSVPFGTSAWMHTPEVSYVPVEIVSINGNDTVTLREMVRQAESDLEGVREQSTRNFDRAIKAEAERDNARKEARRAWADCDNAIAALKEAREEARRGQLTAGVGGAIPFVGVDTSAETPAWIRALYGNYVVSGGGLGGTFTQPVPHKFKVGDRVVHFYSGAGTVTELAPRRVSETPGYHVTFDRTPATRGGVYSEAYLTAETPPVEYRIGDKVFVLDKFPAIVVGFSTSVYGTVYSIRYVGNDYSIGGFGPKYLSNPSAPEWTIAAVALLLRKFDQEIERPGGTWTAAQAFHKEAVKLLQG